MWTHTKTTRPVRNTFEREYIVFWGCCVNVIEINDIFLQLGCVIQVMSTTGSITVWSVI